MQQKWRGPVLRLAKAYGWLRAGVPIIIKPAISNGSGFFVFCGERTDPPVEALLFN